MKIHELNKLGFTKQPDGSFSKTPIQRARNAPAVATRLPRPRAKQADANALEQAQGAQGKGAKRIIVRIDQSRVDLLDPDNLYAAPKFLIDQLRAERLIPNDNAVCIELSVTQTPVPHVRDEGTRIEIIYP